MLKEFNNSYDVNAGIYFKDITNTTPLTRTEEKRLAKRWQNKKDIKARNKLVESNLKFAANIARNYKGLGLSYSDLIQEANAGLFRAADKFEPERGNKFISYAVNWVKESILTALKKRNSLPSEELPVDSNELELLDDLKGFEDIEDEREVIIDNIYINEEYDYEKEKDIATIVKLLLNTLTTREKFVVCKYNGINEKKPKTLEEIGNELNLTKERVRQIHEKAMKKLRAYAVENCITNDIYKG
jgi:RNA polymerase primary sigma factor